MPNLCIIPARGGSKRIPKKNIKDFLGKPIIAYSIETALQSRLFDEVMVSTEDEEIAAIAKKYGAQIPFFRSKDNASDYATTLAVLKEVEVAYKQQYNKLFDCICCLYPAAPLVKGEQLAKGLNLLKEGDLDTVFPIVSFSHPIWRGVEIVDERTRVLWPEYVNSRSQDLQTVYHDSGQWYWYNASKMISSLFTDNSSSLILSEEEVQDIDTLSDWKLAELKYQLLNG